MPSDLRALAARNLHQEALAAKARAGELRAQRDRYVRQLRAEDPARWTHKALARAVGCSEELIALIDRSTPREEPPA